MSYPDVGLLKFLKADWPHQRDCPHTDPLIWLMDCQREILFSFLWSNPRVVLQKDWSLLPNVSGVGKTKSMRVLAWRSSQAPWQNECFVIKKTCEIKSKRNTPNKQSNLANHIPIKGSRRGEKWSRYQILDFHGNSSLLYATVKFSRSNWHCFKLT